MPPESKSLDSLLERLARGDRAAFTPVFQLLWTPIHQLCLRLLGTHADAADAAQTAMQKIFERASEYDPNRPAMAWALAIAAWECRTLARKRTRRRETSDEQLGELAGDDPELVFVHRDLTAAALAAMGELSQSDRDALIATFWEEAASVSGATLRKRRERALDRLRKTFARLYGID